MHSHRLTFLERLVNPAHIFLLYHGNTLLPPILLSSSFSLQNIFPYGEDYRSYCDRVVDFIFHRHSLQLLSGPGLLGQVNQCQMLQ